MNNLAEKDRSAQWDEYHNNNDDDASERQNTLYAIETPERNATVGRMIQRLDALLLLLKDCKGRQCTHPWESYFPSGEVRSLARALDVKYDAFFAETVAKVDFEECTKGYIPEMEGPAWNRSQVFAIVDEVWTGT